MKSPPTYMGAFNVLVWQEGDFWIAQVIEKDICTQASSMSGVVEEIGIALAVHIGLAISKQQQPFIDVPATPSEIVEQWKTARVELNVRDQAIEVGGATPPPLKIKYADSVHA